MPSGRNVRRPLQRRRPVQLQGALDVVVRRDDATLHGPLERLPDRVVVEPVDLIEVAGQAGAHEGVVVRCGDLRLRAQLFCPRRHRDAARVPGAASGEVADTARVDVAEASVAQQGLDVREQPAVLRVGRHVGALDDEVDGRVLRRLEQGVALGDHGAVATGDDHADQQVGGRLAGQRGLVVRDHVPAVGTGGGGAEEVLARDGPVPRLDVEPDGGDPRGVRDDSLHREHPVARRSARPWAVGRRPTRLRSGCTPAPERAAADGVLLTVRSGDAEADVFAVGHERPEAAGVHRQFEDAVGVGLRRSPGSRRPAA